MHPWLKRGGVALGALVGVGGAAAIALLVFVQTADPRFDDVPAPDIVASTDPAVIAQGAYLVNAVAHCTECHGAREAGDHSPKAGQPPMTGGQPIVTPFGKFWPPNITPDATTGVGGYTDAELARVIRHGVLRDGRLSPFMKVAVGGISDADLTAIVSYLRAAEPVPMVAPASQPNFVGSALFAFGMFQPAYKEIPAYAAGGEPGVARGAYLARGPANCVGCHTESDPTADFAYVVSEFSGGGPHPSERDPSMVFVPPNLTPSAASPMAGWTEDRFVARFQAEGRAFPDTIMPWESYSQMTDADLRSIYRFLRSIPAVDRDPGPPLGPAR